MYLGMGNRKNKNSNLTIWCAILNSNSNIWFLLHTLPEDDQYNLLQKVINKQITLNDLKAISAQRKTILMWISTFVKSTNCVLSWEAQEKFPLYASDTQLFKFQNCDLKRCYQEDLRSSAFEQRIALPVVTQWPQSHYFLLMVTMGPPITDNIIRAKYIEVTTGHSVKAIQSPFCGVEWTIVLVKIS